MQSKIFDKRAELGATITWFVAFLVIFFVMLLFIAATALLAKQKGNNAISYLGDGTEGYKGIKTQHYWICF